MGFVPQVERIDWNFPVTVAECVGMARADGSGARRGSRDRERGRDRRGARPARPARARVVATSATCRAVSSSGCSSPGRCSPVPRSIFLDEPTSGLDVQDPSRGAAPARRPQRRGRHHRADDPRPERDRHAPADDRVPQPDGDRCRGARGGARARGARADLRLADADPRTRWDARRRRRRAERQRAALPTARSVQSSWSRAAPRRTRSSSSATASYVATLAGALCGLVGCYVVLRNMSYIGHGLSHAIFGGYAVGRPDRRQPVPRCGRLGRGHGVGDRWHRAASPDRLRRGDRRRDDGLVRVRDRARRSATDHRAAAPTRCCSATSSG